MTRLSKLTTITLCVSTIAACKWPPGGGSNTPQPAADKAGVLLQFNNTFDQTGDDVGGAKMMTDVPILWEGQRVLGPEESAGPNDAFSQSDTFHGYATDPWNKDHLFNNVTPGTWNFAATVNGAPFVCPSTIALSAGKLTTVTIEISKENVFTGCSHN